MSRFIRLLSPPDHAVLSLAVRAGITKPEARKKKQFELLLTHFLQAFFNNDMVSSDGEAKTHTLQVAYAIALPGLILALFLFPPYHFPGGRPFWSQVSDHYFYVMYSLVAVGVGTIFEWDLFFPSIVDVFVFAGLPATNRNLFLARVAATASFLGLFILGVNLLGILFFPAACDLPSPLRHFAAHFVAVSMGGVFSSAFFLGMQEVLLIALPQRMLQIVAPVVQGFAVAVLFTVLLLLPVVTRFLPTLTQTNDVAVRCFPPFWFLGIYERMLIGPSVLPVFATLARIGALATLCALAIAIALYPFAYWRRTRQLVEGTSTRSAQRQWVKPLRAFLHATLLRVPQQRAIHHFISQTLLRTQRQRVYLAMYGGLGMALVVSSAVLFQPRAGTMRLQVSITGLQATLPILIFWVIAGMRASFLGPVDHRASWLFRVIGGRPALPQLRAAMTWVLLYALLIAGVLLLAVYSLAPRELRTPQALATQVLMAVALCVLLRDAFFLTVKTIPFTGVRSAHKTNLAIILIQYLGLFPPLIVVVLGVEGWMNGARNLLLALLLLVSLHVALRAAHQTMATQNANLLEIDGDEDEFPQRLGLRY